VTARPVIRARITEAVHEAVCTVTGTDGAGLCAAYAWCGSLAACARRRDLLGGGAVRASPLGAFPASF
jgi:hypothetical protein